ncbi:MAG TPA: choice-of-anchor D domain-containing protein [Candidatus Sulfotelmatobacter sp.]|nr:choice-of-anchor D domain-containing protein [Candidatus Sulfotelmatobacter sp.]
MRLPQSFTHPFCSCFLSVTIFGAFAMLLPLCPQAAAQQLTASPSSVAFGNVPLGQNETQLIVLRNNGSTSVKVSTMKVLGSEYTASNVSLPFSVPAGQSVSLNVTFTPTVTGWTGGWVDFTSNASNSTLDVQVQGSGTQSDTLSASPSTVSFGQVSVGGSSTQSVVLTNRRNYKVQIYGWKATGGGFTVSGPALPVTLQPSQSVTVHVGFTPSSAGVSAGDLFVSNEGLNIPLSGTGVTTNTRGQLSVSPWTLNFGNVNLGSTVTKSITMTATGASVTVASDFSSNSEFVLSGSVSVPFTIPAGQSMTFKVAFKPTGSGTATGSMQLKSNASDSSVNVYFNGNGTTTTAGQLSISPSSVNFGNVNVGSTETHAITMSATGASVTVSSDASSSSHFVLSGVSLPFTIPAGQSKSFNVGFTPTAAGTVSGSLSFNSNAATAQVVESLTGTGTTPQYSVNLSWNASSGAAGYNIYRSTSATGSFAKINSSLDANTAYTDNGVASGQTYYYEATAINSSGQESARSSPPVSASIP